MSTSWQKIRLKFLAPSSRELLASRPEGIRYLGLENIESGTGKLLLETEQEQVDSSVVSFDEESVLFGKLRPYLAKVAAPDFKGVASTEIMVLKPVGGNNRRFLAYSLLSDEFIKRVSGMTDGAKMPRANPNDVLNLFLCVPPSGIQSRIASYLDAQTAKIDRLMDMRRRQIVLLQEQRVALIQQAVTRGLNPDVPMKDSGIPWLGEIPAHWHCSSLRRFWAVIDCKHLTVPFFEDGYPLASVSEVQSFELDLSQAKRTSRDYWKQLVEGGRQPLVGDLVYCRNTSVGAAACVSSDEPIAMGQDVCLIRSKLQNNRYLNYLLRTRFMEEQLNTILVGATFKRINVADIKSLIVLCPPKSEQDHIVSFIDIESTQIDNLISSCTRQLTLLAEYRAALIHECVTGQREVPDMPTPLVEEAHAL